MLSNIIRRLQRLRQELTERPTRETLLAIDQELARLQQWLSTEAEEEVVDDQSDGRTDMHG